MIEVPIDNPERVKEIFMNGDGNTVAALVKPCKPATEDAPARAVEQQLATQQDIAAELHSVILTLQERLEKVTVACPEDDEAKQPERETLSPIAGHIRTNNDSLFGAITRIRRLTDEIEL